MTGHEGSIVSKRDPRLGLQHPQGRERYRHQRRLGIFGQLQGLARTIPDDGGELLAEGLIDLVENHPRHGKGVGQRLAHANRLGALARKRKCSCHIR